MTPKQIYERIRVNYRDAFQFISFGIHRYAKCSSLRNKKRVTIWQLNSFTNPPQFAYPCIIAAPYQGALNPRLAFILGRIAFARPKRTLCLQRISKIRLSLQSFFVTLASPNFLDEPSETSFESFCTRKSSNKFGFSLVFS